jgi:hypothetical protein
MKKLLLLILLIIGTSAFSINAGNSHILVSDNYIGYSRDCDDDDDDHDDDDDDDDHDDDHDDDDDDDDDHPALPINGYVGVLLILGCMYIFKTVNNEKE